jgi:hypothetical protein
MSLSETTSTLPALPPAATTWRATRRALIWRGDSPAQASAVAAPPANRARFERLYRVYGPGGLYPDGVYGLAAWPESIVLWERIESVPMWLDGLWGAADYSELQLERLSEAWRFGTAKER